MTYAPPPHLRRTIGILLQGDVKKLHRQGIDIPGLQAYADRLLTPEGDRETQRRYAWRTKKARQRAAKRLHRAA